MMPPKFKQLATAATLADLAGAQMQELTGIKPIVNGSFTGRPAMKMDLVAGTLTEQNTSGVSTLDIESGGPPRPANGWFTWAIGVGFSLMIHAAASAPDIVGDFRNNCEGVDFKTSGNWDKAECAAAWVGQFGRAGLSVLLGTKTQVVTDNPTAQAVVVAMTSRASTWFGTSIRKKRDDDELKKRGSNALLGRYDPDGAWTSYCDLFWQTGDSAYWSNNAWKFNLGPGTMKLASILDCHNP